MYPQQQGFGGPPPPYQPGFVPGFQQQQPGFPQQPGYPQPAYGQQPAMGGTQQSVCAIRSRMHGKVIDAEGGSAQAGAKLIMFGQKQPISDNQLWTMQPKGDGWFWIASKSDPNIVFDVEGNGKKGAKICLWNKKSPPANNQLFRLEGEFIRSAQGDNLVLDINGADQKNCAPVILWSQSKSPNQKWTADYGVVSGGVPQPHMQHQNMASPGGTFGGNSIASSIRADQNRIRDEIRMDQERMQREMRGMHEQVRQEIRQDQQDIQNQIHGMHHQQQQQQYPAISQGGSSARLIFESKLNRKLLDAEGGVSEGARIINYEQKYPPAPNQLWRLEPIGNGWSYICSDQNPNLVFDVKGNGAKGSEVILWSKKHPPAENQMFDVRGPHIHCAKDGGRMVLDIKGADPKDCAPVIVWDQSGAVNQQFETKQHY